MRSFAKVRNDGTAKDQFGDRALRRAAPRRPRAALRAARARPARRDPEWAAAGRMQPLPSSRAAGRASSACRAGWWSRHTSSSPPRATCATPAWRCHGASHHGRRRRRGGRRPPAPAPPDSTFGPGSPDLAGFPRGTRGCGRCGDALRDVPAGASRRYSDARGVAELREELAAYLNRVRGTVADPASIVDHARGSPRALRVVAARCGRRGARGSGSRIRPTRPPTAARAAGARAGGDPRGRARASPSTCSRAAVDAVARHARRTSTRPGRCSPPDAPPRARRVGRATDALIIEDDYDAEFRYDRAPVGALHGSTRTRVVPHRRREQDAGARPPARVEVLRPVDLSRAITDAKRRANPAPPPSTSSHSPTLSPPAGLRITCAASTIFPGATGRLLRGAQCRCSHARAVGASAGPTSSASCRPAWTTGVRRGGRGGRVRLQPLSENRLTPASPVRGRRRLRLRPP